MDNKKPSIESNTLIQKSSYYLKMIGKFIKRYFASTVLLNYSYSDLLFCQLLCTFGKFCDSRKNSINRNKYEDSDIRTEFFGSPQAGNSAAI